MVASGGKEAIMDVVCLQRNNNKSLLHIELVTGRYHQIRAQLAAVGFPIYGDIKYGARTTWSGIALHHFSLSFPHPISKKRITISSIDKRTFDF